jgi:two-component system sensor histidine kinase KdpD
MDAGKRLLTKRTVLLLLKGILSLVALTYFCHIMALSKTTVALLLLVLIVIYARSGVLFVSLSLSLFCGLAYGIFFLEPIGSIRVSSPQDLLALLVFLGVAGFVSRIAEQVRIENLLAEERRREVERLYELSQSLLLMDNIDELARSLPLLISNIFGFKAVMLALADSAMVWSSGDCTDIPADELRQLAYGEDVFPLLLPNVEFTPLRMGLKTIGAIALRPAMENPRSRTAITALVATSVERANAVQRFTQLETVRGGEKLRSALIDSITHELRTPLTSIHAAATMLRDSSPIDPETRMELAAIVEEESDRLDRLVGDAVQMAQLDSNSLHITLAPVTLQSIVDQVVEDTHAKMCSHPLSISVEEDSEEVLLDCELVRRVLVHLLENVVHHTPKGTHARISVSRKEERLVFSVVDDGPGIDDRDLPLIFEKFYRGRHEEEKRRKGTGMGLAIVRAILVAMGGGIEVESRLKQGTSFRFWLPLVLPNATSAR